jgi:hypothetical protein
MVPDGSTTLLAALATSAGLDRAAKNFGQQRPYLALAKAERERQGCEHLVRHCNGCGGKGTAPDAGWRSATSSQGRMREGAIAVRLHARRGSLVARSRGTEDEYLMADSERLEAKGPRGEACIIVRTWSRPDSTTPGAPKDRGRPTYRLATGERLNATEDPAVFETLDGTRRFTLRKS